MESPESIPFGAAAVACALCGSTHVAWRVKRTRGAVRGAAAVPALAWSCRGCGAGWEEPLAAGTEAGGSAVAPR